MTTANGMIQMPKIPRLIQIVIAICLIYLMASVMGCSPIKGLKKDLENQTTTEGELAKICAEKFPNIPSKEPKQGSIDTAALINALIGTLCPEQKLQPIPSATEDQNAPLHFQTNTPARKINIDSVIAAIKSHMKPDTIFRPDSAALKAALYDRDNYKKQADAAVKDRDTFKNSLDQSKKDFKIILFVLCLVFVLIGGSFIWKIVQAAKAATPAGQVGSLINKIK